MVTREGNKTAVVSFFRQIIFASITSFILLLISYKIQYTPSEYDTKETNFIHNQNTNIKIRPIEIDALVAKSGTCLLPFALCAP